MDVRLFTYLYMDRTPTSNRGDTRMIHLLTCNGYGTIRTLPYSADAPAECRAEEIRRNDGYNVIAYDGGRLVADAEGWVAEDRSPADPMLAALERRYDGAVGG